MAIALGLRPGQATVLMGSLLALAGSTVSFEEAGRQIEQYLQVQVSANTLRQETRLLGAKQAAQEEKWIGQSQDEGHLQDREWQAARPTRMYGSIDGAFVPLETEWKEAKTVSWYQEGRRYGAPEPHATKISYYTSLEPAETFGELLWGTGVHHRADQASELIFVCDGANWIWRLVTHYFPQAVQIVDWYHACQYLHAAAETLLLADAVPETWLTEMKAHLWEGEVETILRACALLEEQGGPPVARLLSYYRNNLARMRYADFRTQRISSGAARWKVVANKLSPCA